MPTLPAARDLAPEHRPGRLARLLAIAREGDSAATPLVLLVLVAGALALLVAVTLALALLVYELSL